MSKNNWVLGLAVLILIVGLSAWGFSKKGTNPGPKPSSTVSSLEETIPTADNLIKDDEPYFDNNATVMEFYQPSCGWCIKQSEVLNELAKDGYRVKPMNTATNADYWQKYNVSGTPTFLAANGDRVEGYQAAEQLKVFLDAHK